MQLVLDCSVDASLSNASLVLTFSSFTVLVKILYCKAKNVYFHVCFLCMIMWQLF